MIRINAQIDNELAAVATKQVPFAASLALNKTAIGARNAVRGNLPKRFKLRNQWTMRGIQATMSTKGNLTALVTAPGYMQIQETGGQRTSQPGRTLMAPAEALQTGRVVPKKKRPRALLADKAFILQMRGGDAGVFLRYGKKRSSIRLLWWLTDDQKYDDRFKFEQDVNDYVQDRFGAEFAAAMEQAVAGGGKSSAR